MLTPGSCSGLHLQWEGRGQSELELELSSDVAGIDESSGWSFRVAE